MGGGRDQPVKRKTYYAHAKCMYGHPHEKKELAAIRRLLKDTQIVNPRRYEGRPEKRYGGLRFCFQLIDKAHVLVYSKILGRITAGVGAEINYALSVRKLVYQLRDGKLIRQSRPVKHASIPSTFSLYDAWRAKYPE